MLHHLAVAMRIEGRSFSGDPIIKGLASYIRKSSLNSLHAGMSNRLETETYMIRAMLERDTLGFRKLW